MATLWFSFVVLMVIVYVVLDGFDLGAGIVQIFVSRTEAEETRVLKSINAVWDGNEVWLIAAGGTLLFAFPALLAAAFSGFYLSLMILLWLLIGRGIAIEFRHHVDDPLWQSFWSTVFGLSSGALALVFGVALGNVIRGVPLDESGYFFVPLWTTLSPFGSIGTIDWYTLLVGAAAFFALAVHGSLWVVLHSEGEFQSRIRSFGSKCWGPTLLFSIASFAASAVVQPRIFNRVGAGWGPVFLLVALVSMIGTLMFSIRRRDAAAFLSWSLFLVASLLSVACTMFPIALPARTDPRWDLTVQNTATAEHSLSAALYWFVPGMLLAIGYAVIVYRHFLRAANIEPGGAYES